MGVEEFSSFIRISRREFRNLIEDNEYFSKNIKLFLKSVIDRCESGFELKTMEEQLKEEFQSYMEQLKGA